ncbi:hypothetical protein I3760_05G256900 [Carya illinoinensis]|uniref:Late embryogenesis abundant protein LEA-2 subgroup domain-containing protein n=1 Tax=Carya illinoinensis TaxID=32201 RepID=A0A8T1QNA0_CARIL|nr:late embryogenesis abundant protein At1g64065-like [Carya illinoinensis]KAG2709774.1 hypothetical protein I3760_05G256900 [Carya illinoinensis]KAG6656056.1 hypothetical protein CIPAW_05G260600 [Carya illinoinensis]
MMAEKEQSPYPLAPANGYVRSDAEAVRAHPDKQRKKKRMKCIAYIAAFAVFQTIIILGFALTVMRIKSPKFRVRAASFTGNFDVTNSSYNLQMNAQFTVKNTNFGHFKYEYGTVRFAQNGVRVGEANINDARVRARSTKKVNATVVLSSSNNNPALTSDIVYGRLPLTISSKLEGKVHLMKVFKKKKSAQMNCTVYVNLGMHQIENLTCT